LYTFFRTYVHSSILEQKYAKPRLHTFAFLG
jgi:hypothetical protein